MVLASCAQIRSPQGGDKDLLPPVIKMMVPPNYSTNFSGNKILLEFDEYVTLKDIQEQLLVSPPLLKRPEISVKGKSVIIQLDEVLEETTTYTFNLGEGIVDVNEGNPLDSNTVVFSTGPFLDSLFIRGSVFNAYSRAPMDCGVLLHRSLEDSAIVNDRPQYYSRTDERGNFELKNLREGIYRLYALKDIDKNYKWSEVESMAFFEKDVIVSAEDTTFYQLSSFEHVPSKQFVKRYESQSHGKVEFVLNKAPLDLSITGLGFVYDSLIVLGGNSTDSVNCWFQNLRDLEDPELILTDGEWSDTLSLGSFDEGEKMEVPELAFSNKFILEQSPKKDLELSINSPISRIDTSNMLLRFDTISSSFATEKVSALSFGLSTDWEQGRNVNLVIYPGAIQDIYSQKNDTTVFRVKVLGKEDHSELTLTVSCGEPANYIIELFEGARVERRESFSDSTLFVWDWIVSGEYQLRIYNDENGNGVWDTGNYFEKRQPEQLMLFDTPIQLRPNWLLEQKWDLKFE
ncbi:MAG: hypothetical protein HKN39_00650 [Flavobacteriales bacterium]|nr:hypothetical protein [Flavobacteriales bacterium]